jgi:hypothetical protein
VSLSRLRPGYRFLGMTIAGGGRSGFFFSHPTSALCHKAYAIGQLKVICVIKFQRPIVVNDPPYCDFCEAAVEFKINDSPRVCVVHTVNVATAAPPALQSSAL